MMFADSSEITLLLRFENTSLPLSGQRIPQQGVTSILLLLKTFPPHLISSRDISSRKTFILPIYSKGSVLFNYQTRRQGAFHLGIQEV